MCGFFTFPRFNINSLQFMELECVTERQKEVASCDISMMVELLVCN